LQTIPDVPNNLVRQYLYAIGKDKVPPAFHLWSCLTVMAATVQDRIYMPWRWDDRIIPSLFTFLVGPSGSGKGEAIRCALHYADKIPCVNAMAGRITASGLYTTCSTPRKEQAFADPKKRLIVLPELKENFHNRELARATIATLTDWYDAHDRTVSDTQRQHGGTVKIVGPVISVLAGTTYEWLVETIDVKDLSGGFFGRVATVSRERTNLRIYQPIMPADWRFADAVVYNGFLKLAGYAGEIEWEPRALALNKQWFDTRPEPDREEERPFWEREDKFVLKVSMLFALADFAAQPLVSPVVMEEHVRAARRSVASLRSGFIQLIDRASLAASITAQHYNSVSQFMSRVRQATHSRILRHGSSQGILAPEMLQILTQLRQENRIDQHRNGSPGTGGKIYTWRTRTISVD
jgi:hypothetical protein